MNPSRSNIDAGASGGDAEATRLMNSGEKDGPPRNSSFQSPALSAPLLPSSPYNPEMMDLEPPSYDSVVAQYADDLRNRFSSSSTGNIHQAPYPTGPGSAPQTPYPTGTGFSLHAVGNPPYPGGPGLGSPATSHLPYPTGSGYTPRLTSQAPYPTGPVPMPMPMPMPMPKPKPMPMPGAVKARIEFGLIDFVTTSPPLSRLESPPRTVIQPTAPDLVDCDEETQEESTKKLQKAAEKQNKFVLAVAIVVMGLLLVTIYFLVKGIKAYHH